MRLVFLLFLKAGEHKASYLWPVGLSPFGHDGSSATTIRTRWLFKTTAKTFEHNAFPAAIRTQWRPTLKHKPARQRPSQKPGDLPPSNSQTPPKPLRVMAQARTRPDHCKRKPGQARARPDRFFGSPFNNWVGLSTAIPTVQTRPGDEVPYYYVSDLRYTNLHGLGFLSEALLL